MFESIIGLVVLVLLVLSCIWRHDLKNVLLFGAITMYVVGITVTTVEFQTSAQLIVHDVAFTTAPIMFVACGVLYAKVGMQRRRMTKPQAPVREPAMTHQ